MPIEFSRRLTGRERTAPANRRLGYVLAFVAGAINAGGFLAVQQYTSHMTGIVSLVADHLALGAWELVLAGVGALLSFLLGAVCSSVMVNYGRVRARHSEYAAPLLLEAGLLLIFGILGSTLAHVPGLFVPATVMVLCFIMGLQNALMSKASRSEIRTTHLTGIVTDIGIELGKVVYWNGKPQSGRAPVVANRPRLVMLLSLAGSFFLGGVTGALGFKYLGYISTVPLALLLVILAITPAIDDLRAFGIRRQDAG